ncbi:invasion associated locus B family protein [Microvirga thermotolerans]|nr:invasion associated locus B family protein [Microvirga thermotolerans]
MAAASAQEPSRAERFADWEVVCSSTLHAESSTPPSKTNCQAVQRLTAQGSEETVFALTVVRDDQRVPVAIVSIPLGGYIARGIELSVDGKKPYKVLVETCNAAGCHAGFPLSGQIAKEFRSGKLASFRLWSAKDKSADVTVSLKGFAEALARLERSS